MALEFFFYDLETSGFNPAQARVMQFAGQRTDEKFKPVGKPINVLVKLTEDILPEPDAVLVHGITPQKTLSEGVTETELARIITQDAFSKDTVAVGFNNIRFDDEFVRHTLWRNFYDPYEWHWKDGRSRWDMLDTSRMTRALRPDGVKWPLNEEGIPVNKLGALAQANKIKLDNAHDALADVNATIGLAQKLLKAQPKLISWLISQRDKNEVNKTISAGNPKPFVYTSGRFPSEFLKTTVAVVLGPHPSDSNSVLVYDLRHSPKEVVDFSVEELTKRIYIKREDRDKLAPIPIKKLSINKCPAVAPLGTLDKSAQDRINLTITEVEKNYKDLATFEGLAQRIYEAFKSVEPLAKRIDPEGQIYDGFIGDKDKALSGEVRKAKADKLADWHPAFIDERLSELLLRYKARNFPTSLSQAEQGAWEGWRVNKLLKGVDGGINLKSFSTRLQKLASEKSTDQTQRFILEELQLYGESIAPDQLFDA